MIEESLLKSNFVGRDGFRWWIGQVPPIEAQGKQENGEGWGNRVKVRIMGYHTHDEKILPNNDLPWAQVLLPATAGTGAANYATNIKIQPGDVVFGFFLDGDNGQIPVILGCFGRTSEVSTEKFKNPFEPFTGYTNQVKNDGSVIPADQTNEQNKNSQKSPRTLDPSQVGKLNSELKSQYGSEFGKSILPELSYFNAIGNKIISANSCKSTIAQSLMSEMENLVGRLKIPSIAMDISSEIKRTVDKIQGMSNGFIGQMFKNVYTKLIGILSNGLDLLYSKIFAYVYSITPCDPACKFAVAHAAGVLAQQALVAPVKALEKGIPCAASKSINSSYKKIKDLVEKYVKNVENYTECSGVEFTAGLLNVLIDEMIRNLSPLLDAVTKILSPGFSLENLLRGSVSNYLNSGGGVLDCKQNRKKCSGLTGNLAVGSGSKGYRGNDLYKQILDTMNAGKKVGKAVIYENELPDSVITQTEEQRKDFVTSKITNKVSKNETTIKIRDIDLVKEGYSIKIKDEVMSVLKVETGTHKVQVSRGDLGNQYKSGTKVKIYKSFAEGSTFSRAASDFESLVGSLNVFNGKSKNSNASCYTGPPLNCNPPTAQVFGGGGYGARVRPLMGKYKMKRNGKRVGSIIGVQVQNSGVGYRYPPNIQFTDNCNDGYGAIARTQINDDGRIISAYMVSTGENYPVSEIQEYEVINVVVEDGGSGYIDPTITDDFGNKYEAVVDEDTGEILEVTPINTTEVTDLPQINITSDTGTGASLIPIIGSIEYPDSLVDGEPNLPLKDELLREREYNVPQIPDPAEPLVVQLAIQEQELPALAPEVIRAREKARLRRRILQEKVNYVKDCPT
jgi:hypothetical protein